MGIGDWGLGVGGLGVWGQNRPPKPKPTTPTQKKIKKFYLL